MRIEPGREAPASLVRRWQRRGRRLGLKSAAHPWLRHNPYAVLEELAARLNDQAPILPVRSVNGQATTASSKPLSQAGEFVQKFNSNAPIEAGTIFDQIAKPFGVRLSDLTAKHSIGENRRGSGLGPRAGLIKLLVFFSGHPDRTRLKKCGACWLWFVDYTRPGNQLRCSSGCTNRAWGRSSPLRGVNQAGKMQRASPPLKRSSSLAPNDDDQGRLDAAVREGYSSSGGHRSNNGAFRSERSPSWV
jgi:hypothetical protein